MSQPKHYYNGSETRDRDVFATIVDDGKTTILTARIRVEIPHGALEDRHATVHCASGELMLSIAEVVWEAISNKCPAWKPSTDAVATNYEGRPRAPDQGV